MKILSLQMIPWCFLGNQMSSCMQVHDDDDQQQQQHKKMKKKKKKKRSKSGSGIIKVIKWDGVVKIYERGVEAWELMEEYPKHMLCRSDSFYIGQRIPPLSPHDLLLLGHNYFLLPNHLFQSVLSFVNLASSFASSNPNSSSSSSNNNKYGAFLNNKDASASASAAASCQPPFDIQKSPSGSLSIRVSEDFISQLMLMQHQQQQHHDDEQQQEEENRVLVLCTTPQLQKEYRQLVVVGRRQWKPKLEMIRETSPRDKRNLSSFGGKN